MPDSPPAPDRTFPLLVGPQVEAHALVVRRATSTHLAAMLRAHGQHQAADMVEEDRDHTELSRSIAAIPTPAHGQPEHTAGCRTSRCRCDCDPARTCGKCHQCACWRDQCCARAGDALRQRRARTEALRRLLDNVGTSMLTELRQTAADAEETALRNALARRVRLLIPDHHRYEQAVFEATDSALCMGHADYSFYDVQLYDVELDQHEQAPRTAPSTCPATMSSPTSWDRWPNCCAPTKARI